LLGCEGVTVSRKGPGDWSAQSGLDTGKKKKPPAEKDLKGNKNKCTGICARKLKLKKEEDTARGCREPKRKKCAAPDKRKRSRNGS